MRVLNVNHLLDPVSGGGTAERTFQLSRALTKLGTPCTVLTLDVGLAAERRAELVGGRLVALPCLNQRFFVPRVSLNALFGVIRDADVVHLMGHWTLLNGLVAMAARNLGKPYIVCPAGSLQVFGRSQLLKCVYNVVLGYTLVEKASGWIAVSPNELAQFEHYGVARENVQVVPNGINPADFISDNAARFRSRFALPENPLILFVGRLNEIKGPDLLLEAFAAVTSRFPDYHLVFAGPDGGLLGALKDMAHASSVSERIHFIGHISGNDKSDAYHAAELLVIPSRQEAMSIVVLEAGICATPVLLTDRCGFDEVREVAGGKVVAATAHALELGMQELLGRRTELTAMGERLRDFVRGHFLWQDIALRHLRLFEKIVEGAR